MGCTQSKTTTAVIAPEKKNGVQTSFKPGDSSRVSTSEKPKPLVFAIMRNGHEVIRGAQRDMAEMIYNGDLKGAIDMWEKHNRWMFIHMTMEEGLPDKVGQTPMGMFRLLDSKFSGIADDAGLSALHVELHKLEHKVQHAFENKDLKQLKTYFPEYLKVNLAHLEKEEAIMMPKVMEMKKMGVNLKQVMIEELLDTVVDHPDFEHFIKFGNQILEKHHEGNPRVRVWDHALWAVATPQQWAVWDAWIKEVVQPETYQELQNAINGV